MKLGYIAYRDLERQYGKEYADKVANMKGLKSLWWQFKNGIGPHHKLLRGIFNTLGCATCCAIVVFVAVLVANFIPAPIFILMVVIFWFVTLWL